MELLIDVTNEFDLAVHKLTSAGWDKVMEMKALFNLYNQRFKDIANHINRTLRQLLVAPNFFYERNKAMISGLD